jgi:hypothetical protein
MLTGPFSRYLKAGHVQIAGARVAGDIDLNNQTIQPELFLIDDRIEAAIHAHNTVFTHNVCLQGPAVIQPLDISGAVLQKSLYLGVEDEPQRCQSEAAEPRYGLAHRSLAGIRLEGAQIDGDLYMKSVG